GDGEVEVGVRVAGELGRQGVRAEPRRYAARVMDRTQRRDLRLAIEAVARLSLEGRRAVPKHPVAMLLHGLPEPGLAGGARRADGREDAAAARVQLLVADAG